MMYHIKLKRNEKFIKITKNAAFMEMTALFLTGILIFILSTLQVKDIVSIWNQNDELGVWQGGAWLLGLDWSEVATLHGYYGYGYGFILAFFIRYFGHNTVLMTQMAIYFQALIHTGTVLIAWYCIKKMFPSANAVMRVTAASVCILSIPDLFYIYNFFSECWLRFIVWVIFFFVVSYSYHKKWYKLFLINLVSVYSFSVHQRCILLIGMAALLTLYEGICYFIKNGFRKRMLFQILISIIGVVIFYGIEYKYAQKDYISALYSASSNSSVSVNLLSSRNYTIRSILQNVVFNLETERIALQNMLGNIYYVCAFDCGFVFYGFILCFTRIKRSIVSKKDNHFMPYLFMSSMALFGILLSVYQSANEGVYTRVELMHYGRYSSYLLAPMMMLGIIELLTEEISVIRRNAFITMIVFLISGLSTYYVLKNHNVTNLFAFHNACPGIKSVYYQDGPFTATLYHTLLGVLWIFFPAMAIMQSKKYAGLKKYMEIAVFVVISVVWINVANQEWRETYEEKEVYVKQTYDLQNVLDEVDEFAAFKSFSYGSGLLQYNNVFSKIHVCQTLDELGEEENGLLVVSQKGIEEMDTIAETYEIEYENEMYFVWRFVMEDE